MRQRTPEDLDDLIAILNASNRRAVHPAGGDDHSRLHDLDSALDHFGTLSWAKVNKTGAAGDGIAIAGELITVDGTVVRTSRTLTAGDGLVGGGTLAADRSFSVGAGDGITTTGSAVSVNMTDLVNVNQGLHVVTNDVGVKLASPSGIGFNGVTAGLELAATVAGDGLVMASQVLAVGAGDGIDVTADAVAVDVTDIIGAGLAEDGGNNLTLATPGTLSTASINEVQAGGHTHAITASSNPGVAAALLKTDTSGNLRLQNLTLDGDLAVNGNDITSTGDLTLTPGGSINFVKIGGDLRSSNYVANTTGWSITHDTGILEVRSFTADAGIIAGALDVGEDFTVGLNVLFVDESGGRVGINRAPDAQFQLDILGNLRASGYIVGQHAIQLAEAAMICHYDGAYLDDYEGSLLGHLGQIGTMTGPAVFRPGQFGKAVQFAAAGTNLARNPVAEVNTTDWSSSQGSASIERDTSKRLFGSASVKNTLISASSIIQNTVGITGLSAPSGDYTFSVWVNFDDMQPLSTNADLRLRFYWSGGANAAAMSLIGYTTNLHLKSGWVLVTGTGQPDYADRTAVRAYMDLRNASPVVGDYLHYDGAQWENTSHRTPLAYGDMPGHSWTGTAHLSTTTRPAASLYYDNPLSATAGTVMLWWRPAASRTTQPTSCLFDDGAFIAWYDSTDGYIKFSDGTNVASSEMNVFEAMEWVHFAFTYGPSGINIYRNGDLVRDGLFTAPASLDSQLFVGTNHIEEEPANGWIDDLVVTTTQLDADLIRAIYESNAPVFAETSTWSFQLPNNLVWADEEGFWMRDAAGNAMFGLVGVDGKSWAGLSNDAGDMVIGNAANDYIRWDASAGTLTIAGDGGGLTNIDGGSIQTGTITAVQIAADTITAVQIAADTITATEIAAGTITATEIAADAITAVHIDVSTLSAISADMGTLTAGTITGGTIRTAASGARIEMNSTRILGTDGSVTQWEALAATGKLTAGAGNVELSSDGVTLVDNRQLKFKQGTTVIGEAGVTETGSVRLIASGGIGSTLITDPYLITGAEWTADDGTPTYNQTYDGKTCGKCTLTSGGFDDYLIWYSDWISIAADTAVVRFSHAQGAVGAPLYLQWNAGSENALLPVSAQATWRSYEFFAQKPSGATAVRLKFDSGVTNIGTTYTVYLTDFDIRSMTEKHALLDVKSTGYASAESASGLRVRPGIIFPAPYFNTAAARPVLQNWRDTGIFLHDTGSARYLVVAYTHTSGTYYKYLRLDTTGTPTWTHATSLP